MKHWLTIRIENGEAAARCCCSDDFTDAAEVVHTVTESQDCQLPAEMVSALMAILGTCEKPLAAKMAVAKARHIVTTHELGEKKKQFGSTLTATGDLTIKKT